MERRVVIAQDAAVEVGVLAVLHLYGTGVSVLHNLHRQDVGTVGVEQVRDVDL